MKPTAFSAIVLFLIVAVLPRMLFAEDREARKTDTLTLYLENDLFGFKNKDRYYTHGTKVSWISQDLANYRDILRSPPWLNRFVERMPFVNTPGEQRTVSLSLGQNIYTPQDKQRSDLILNDRPYAGMTYLAMGLHSRSQRLMDTLELDLGIVGPDSYAEDCQEAIHKWIGSVDPQGWKHQLHNEPVVNFYFERKWRPWQATGSGGLGFDCIPHLGVAAGTVYTGINMGGQVRFGWNLPNDFGTYLIRPGADSSAPIADDDPRFLKSRRTFGIHLFFAVDGNVVARNIFLDGNTFRDSHSVAKKPLVVDLIGGIGIIVQRFKITYSYVRRTKEFDSQPEDQHFGAFSASLSF
ncbi:MAG: lipid A deacylase LpxR family protein [Deltaproteobacteria bacterium]|nr:lipid A deacylase LpxR family protein [Deltaproteobacteria bacterium]